MRKSPPPDIIISSATANTNRLPEIIEAMAGINPRTIVGIRVPVMYCPLFRDLRQVQYGVRYFHITPNSISFMRFSVNKLHVMP